MPRRSPVNDVASAATTPLRPPIQEMRVPSRCTSTSRGPLPRRSARPPPGCRGWRPLRPLRRRLAARRRLRRRVVVRRSAASVTRCAHASSSLPARSNAFARRWWNDLSPGCTSTIDASARSDRSRSPPRASMSENRPSASASIASRASQPRTTVVPSSTSPMRERSRDRSRWCLRHSGSAASFARSSTTSSTTLCDAAASPCGPPRDTRSDATRTGTSGRCIHPPRPSLTSSSPVRVGTASAAATPPARVPRRPRRSPTCPGRPPGPPRSVRAAPP